MQGLETVNLDIDIDAEEPKSALETGITGLTRLGDYLIEKTLGVGAMGLVFQAHEKTLNRKVALKVLKSSLNRDEEFCKRFLVEARAAAALDHPNIVRLYRVGKDRETGRLFMSMEYVEGRDLDRFIERGKLTFSNILRVAMSVANALEHARQKKLLHRDIKPKNIMLGSKKRVLILDFGLAKFSGGKDITRSGMVMGSPDYMAPEQFETSDVDHRADLYSLGVVLYEMLAGGKPFAGDSVADLMHLHKYAFPRNVCKLRRNVPAGFEPILGRLLAKNREKRYETSRQLYKDLRKLRTELEESGEIDGRPGGNPLEPVRPHEAGNFDDDDIIDVRSSQPARGARRKSLPARNRLLASFVVLLLLVGLGTAGLTAWSQQAPVNRARRAESVAWGMPVAAWTGDDGIWSSVGGVQWQRGPDPTRPEQVSLSGDGRLLRSTGNDIWRVEGLLLERGARSWAIHVEVGGRPYVGLRFFRLGATVVRAFEILHQDADGETMAALDLQAVVYPAEGLDISVSVVKDYAAFEVAGVLVASKTLPENAQQFSLSVVAEEVGNCSWRALQLRQGTLPPPP